MSLSEREQKILKQLEQDLMSDDAIKRAVKNTVVTKRNRAVGIASAGIIVGILLILSIAFSQLAAAFGAFLVFASVVFLAVTFTKPISKESSAREPK